MRIDAQCGLLFANQTQKILFILRFVRVDYLDIFIFLTALPIASRSNWLRASTI